MADLEYPLINGLRYSWSSIAISIKQAGGGALTFLGFKSINFNEKVDPAKIHGTNQNILGSTAGMYDADGDFEMYQLESDLLVDALGSGWANKAVTITAQYIDDQQPTRTKILTVRLVARTQGGSEGAEAMTSKFTMFFLAPIEDNGVTMVPPISAASFAFSL